MGMGSFVGGVGTIVLLGTLTSLSGCWYSVDEGERAVITTWGKVEGEAGPGFHGKNPISQSAHTISIRQRTLRWSGDSALEAYSSDQQPARVAVSVSYSIPANSAAEVYSRFKDEEGLEQAILWTRVPQQFKVVFGSFNATRAITARAELNDRSLKALQEAVEGQPVVIDGFQIEDISFSDAYEASVEARMLAEVEVMKLRQNAEREKVQAEITVTKAQAEASSSLARAEAEAKSIRLRNDAEADGIKARGAALAQNSQLIELIRAERWDGKLPTTMVPGGAVPFVNVTP